MVPAVIRERPADPLPGDPRPVMRDPQHDQPTAPSLDPRPPTLDPPLSEATLARLWAGQRFPASALVTGDGMPLRVLHPGLRGRGAGPDFRDAIIAAAGRLLRGDVELHRRSSDFRAHGHHRDPRYDGLVLHVVFDDDEQPLRGAARPVLAGLPLAHRLLAHVQLVRQLLLGQAQVLAQRPHALAIPARPASALLHESDDTRKRVSLSTTHLSRGL